jgi:MYXO-CTERM domain-containing protein
MKKVSNWCAMMVLCMGLAVSSPVLAQNDNDNDRKEKKDRDNDDSDRDGKEDGFDDWGLLGLLGLLGLAGLRKSDDKHITVDRRTDVPRSDSPVR